MIDTSELVDRYVGMWNEPDTDVRAETVAALWAPDAVNFTASFEARGHDQLMARVAGAYERYVGSGDYRFRLAGQPTMHHGAIKLTWEMVGTADGEVATIGVEFLILNDHGRIQSDHQFIEG